MGDTQPRQPSMIAAEPTAAGEIPGGFSQLFNRAISTGALTRCSLPARALYPFLVWAADTQAQFVISGKSQPYLQKVSGLSQNALRKAIASLQEHGLLRVVREPRRPSAEAPMGVPAMYQLLVPAPLPSISEGKWGHEAPPRTVTTSGNVPPPGDTTWDYPAPPRGRASVSRVGAPSAPKKRSSERSSRSGGLESKVDDLGEGARLLVDAGLDADVAVTLASMRDLFALRVYAERSKQMEHPIGWLVAAIRGGYQLHKATANRLKAQDREASASVKREADRVAKNEENADLRRRQSLIDATVDGWFEVAPAERSDALFEEFLGTLPARQRASAERKRGNPQNCPPFRVFLAERLQLA